MKRCQVCQEEFSPKRKDQVNCSLKCRYKQKNKNRRAEGYYDKWNSDPKVKLRKLQWARNNKEKMKAWRDANPEKVRFYYAKNSDRRNGYPIEFTLIKLEVKKRDKFLCTRCQESNTKTLIVHHLDWDKQHNDSSNLTTLCRKCHGKEHKENLLKVRFTR